MKVCVPVAEDGSVDPRWGRARRVAVGEVSDGVVANWAEHDVRWDERHDEGTEGSHHARVATFLRDHGVEVVAADHMGRGMQQMLEKMGVRVAFGAAGDAREAALTAASRGDG